MLQGGYGYLDWRLGLAPPGLYSQGGCIDPIVDPLPADPCRGSKTTPNGVWHKF